MHDTACLAPFSRCDQLFADEHSANPCPTFLAAITYARLVVENWTSPVSIWSRTADGRLPMRRSYILELSA